MMTGGDLSPLVPEVYSADLLAELPVLGRIADIEVRILFSLDSGDMQPHHWVELARAVHEALGERQGDRTRRFDGVVIIHGTDTMAYTASALAFLLAGLDRPVVLTGAMRPLGDIRTDARANLVDACELATMPVPEVGIAFNSKLLRGCRSTKLDAWGMDAFGSPGCAPLVTLGVGCELGAHVLPPRAITDFDPRIESRVLAVRVFPGLDPALLHGALRTGVRGLVLEAYGTGNIPHLEKSLVPVIEDAVARDVPVAVVSQCTRGAVELSRYEGGARAAQAGAFGAGHMTTHATLVKLMIALGRAPDGDRVSAARNAFDTRWAGEW